MYICINLAIHPVIHIYLFVYLSINKVIPLVLIILPQGRIILSDIARHGKLPIEFLVRGIQEIPKTM